MDFTSRSYPALMTCVYRLYDIEGRLLYVGITNDFDVRFKQHAAEKTWWPLVARRDITWFSNRFDAMYEESRAIDRESPVHNDRAGLHPVGLMVVQRHRIDRHGPDRSDGELIVSAFWKDRIYRDVAENKADAVLAFEGEARGVLLGLDRYRAACAAMGVDPVDPETARVVDAELLIG